MAAHWDTCSGGELLIELVRKGMHLLANLVN